MSNRILLHYHKRSEERRLKKVMPVLWGWDLKIHWYLETTGVHWNGMNERIKKKYFFTCVSVETSSLFWIVLKGISWSNGLHLLLGFLSSSLYFLHIIVSKLEVDISSKVFPCSIEHPNGDDEYWIELTFGDIEARTCVWGNFFGSIPRKWSVGTAKNSISRAPLVLSRAMEPEWTSSGFWCPRDQIKVSKRDVDFPPYRTVERLKQKNWHQRGEWIKQVH